MRVAEVSTPAIVVDLDVLDRNLDRMAAYCAAHGLGLRPHTKTHKTLEVAELQLERGALGLTVAKVGEAEVMAQTGARQILDEDHATVNAILDAYGPVNQSALQQSLVARAAVMTAWYPILYPNPNAERQAKLNRRIEWLEGV